MTPGSRSSLAVLLACVGGLAAAAAGPRTLVAPPAAKAPVGATVTVHRCVDARGQVTLQDEPCPPGSRDEPREMQRPVDPPRSARRTPPPRIEPLPEPPPPPPREVIPPPAMYLCTSYDGDERFSENYDPNPRCEPIVVYYPYPNYINPTQGLSCRWVEDSCVRLSDRQSCERWRVREKEAFSDFQRAFSDTQEYRRSELARIRQIVAESCS